MAVKLDDVRGGLATTARAWRGRLKTLRRPHALYLNCPEAGHTPADDAQAWQAPLDAFEAWCAQHPGARCELALSSAATLWHVAPHGQSARAALAQCWLDAFAQWAHYLDVDLNQPEAMALWHLQEAPAQGFTLMAATPLALAGGLQDVAARHGVQLLWLGPWWVRGLARWLHDLPDAQPDVADAQASLRLSEPGWAWQAQAEPVLPQASVLRRPWGRGGRGAWRLTQLAWVDTRADADVDVFASTSGQAQAHTSCQAVDLSLLRGQAAVWSPA